MGRDVKRELIQKIQSSYPEFDEDTCEFVIDVRGMDGGFHYMFGNVWNYVDSKPIKGDDSIYKLDEVIDLVIEVIEKSGALKWGSYETVITLTYSEGVIGVITQITNEIWGEL